MPKQIFQRPAPVRRVQWSKQGRAGLPPRPVGKPTPPQPVPVADKPAPHPGHVSKSPG